MPRTGVAPQIRALAERYPEMSKAAIARKVGCHVSNVKQVLARYLSRTSIEELRDFQETKPDCVDAVAHRILSSVSDRKITKMSAQSAVTAFAILTDKAQLLRGQPTNINAMLLVDAVEALKLREQ